MAEPEVTDVQPFDPNSVYQNTPGTQQQQPIDKNELSPVQTFARGLKGYVEHPEEWAVDKTRYGKPWSYDADATGSNFNRYYQRQGVYKQIGFSPWRDNESAYKERTTLF